MTDTTTPAAGVDADTEAERLPAGVTCTKSGTFRARLGKRNLGNFPTLAAAVAAVEAARAELGLPPPRRRRRLGEPPPTAPAGERLPPHVQRRASGWFKARFRHAGGFVDAGTFASVAEAVAARDRLREQLGLPPAEPASAPTPAPEPARPPRQPARPEPGKLGARTAQTPPPEPAAPPRRAQPPSAEDAPTSRAEARWWREARKRIDQIVARAEAEGDGFVLPPDPRKRNAPR